MNLTENEKNGMCEGFCLVKSVEKRTSAKGGSPYLDMTLSDKSGEITAKYWEYNEELCGSYAAGDIVKVRGSISPYMGADQLRINRIRKSVPEDGIDPADFVPTADCDPTEMYNELLKIANKFTNEEIKKIVVKIYEDYRESLLYWPAASKMHHAMRGGLLYHTLSIVRLAQKICEIYSYVDADLLLGGAMLHDIAKIDEFELSSCGTVSQYTLEGNLVGHIAKGAIIIDRYASLLGTPKEITIMLEHMILSHHGTPDFGAAVRPALIEADILSVLDNLDAKMFEMAEAVGKTKPGEFTTRMYSLDNRKFYNPGLEEVVPSAKLF